MAFETLHTPDQPASVGVAALVAPLRTLDRRALAVAGGKAASLGEMVDFYDRRFNIGYTDREREDLINFLSAL